LESLIYANQQLNLNVHITVLTRNVILFSKKYPHLVNHSCVSFCEGDIKNFEFPSNNYSYIIHAAADMSGDLHSLYTSIDIGTKHLLKFAVYCGVKSFLLISSGAVYEKKISQKSLFDEKDKLNFNEEISYSRAKVNAENYAISYAKNHNFPVKIARCFAFVGPYLTNQNFAIQNFIYSGLQGKSIVINGDGTSCRSYLYAADLMIWLWTILIKGENVRPYNVGSNAVISIYELANYVANSFNPPANIIIKNEIKNNAYSKMYVPNTNRAQNELLLRERIQLRSAIDFTKLWVKSYKI
jgi:dTDP-glucose 4,6-dehydratase